MRPIASGWRDFTQQQTGWSESVNTDRRGSTPRPHPCLERIRAGRAER
jgi:hypothetical protein